MSAHDSHGAALIDRVRAQRAKWVDVAPGKRVQIVRPPEVQAAERFMRPSAVPGQVLLNAGLAEVQDYVRGWDGITEADIVGSAGASDLPAPFSQQLWAVVVEDHADWMRVVAQGLLDLIVEHQQTKAGIAKN